MSTIGAMSTLGAMSMLGATSTLGATSMQCHSRPGRSCTCTLSPATARPRPSPHSWTPSAWPGGNQSTKQTTPSVVSTSAPTKSAVHLPCIWGRRRCSGFRVGRCPHGATKDRNARWLPASCPRDCRGVCMRGRCVVVIAGWHL